MNRIMRRWVKAGALILKVRRDRPERLERRTAGRHGRSTWRMAGASRRGRKRRHGRTDGMDGRTGMDPAATGPPGAGVIALGFSYAPFNEPDDADHQRWTNASRRGCRIFPSPVCSLTVPEFRR